MKAIFVIVALVILTVGFLLFRSQQSSSPVPSNTSQENKSQTKYTFETPKKSAHFESSTPEHGEILAGVPINVVVNFNFDLAKPSKIEIHYFGSVEKIGPNEWGVGDTIIDSNKLSMRRKMNPEALDGKYSVAYTACWPDGSCHDGHFQFAIDKSLSQGFTDNTNKKEVEVKMSNIMFVPQNVRISKGTKVTWVNDDSVEHFVNTDSHPAHTYYKAQNSQSLAKGESYSLTFNTVGIYPYHCSAHADQMAGNILVE